MEVSEQYTKQLKRPQARSWLSSMSVTSHSTELHFSKLMSLVYQIDLESTDEDLQEVQAEISLLSTCASPFVTQYKASFLRGYKLWIVMEYLGGGSCQDLVETFNLMLLHGLILIGVTAQTRGLLRTTYRYRLPTNPSRTPVLAPRGKITSRHQSCQHSAIAIRESETGRLWRRSSAR